MYVRTVMLFRYLLLLLLLLLLGVYLLLLLMQMNKYVPFILLLPMQDFWQLLGMQLLGAIVIIAAGASMALVYGVLYVIPMQPFAYILVR